MLRLGREWWNRGVFKHAAGAAADADSRNQIEDDIFRGDAARESSIDSDLKGLRSPLQQALRGQNLFHFAGADAQTPARRKHRAWQCENRRRQQSLPGCVAPYSGPMT